MKTIGESLKEVRERKKLSLLKVERETKIKRGFIEAIESGDWVNLPEFPVILGFVKNLARYLGISERQAVALLKRDYPPKSLSINPKPDVSSKFVWSPRLTFLVGTGIFLLIIISYIIFQYVKFVSPPSLVVYEPKNGQVVHGGTVKVSGKTEPDATIEVNNQLVLVGQNGEFLTNLNIYEGTEDIVVKASFRAGKETAVTIKIKPELN